MARMSFDTYQEAATVLNQNNGDGIKMFGLKDDGHEAVVRIMHDSTEDFDIGTCHKVKIGDRYRKVGCLRDPREPVDKCPLCKSGAKIEQRIFIHMLRYDKNEAGQVTVTPVVWERTAREYANKLKNMIQEYGPLSDCIFKIRRNGKAGDMSTTYELLYANPTVYRPELYPKDEKAFEGYSAFGKVVMDKTFDEISEYLATGQFPQRQNATNNNAGPVNEQPTYGVAPTPTTNPLTIPNNVPYGGGYVPQAAPAPTAAPQGYTPTTTTAEPVARPTRYY